MGTTKSILEQASEAIKGYRVTAIKTRKGRHGEPLASGRLMRGRVLVCQWQDDDHGGAMWFQIVTPGTWAAFQALVEGSGLAWPDSAPKGLAGKLIDFEVADTVISEMANEVICQRIHQRNTKRLSKFNVVRFYAVDTDSEVLPDAQQAAVDKKYPEPLACYRHTCRSLNTGAK